jgi:hypothetical protein
VRQVLNPDGFVRRAHKSADQNLGATITMPESPWTAEGSIVDRQWDFNNAWMGGRRYWPSLDKHIKLQNSTLAQFCTVDTIPVIPRNKKTKYINDENYDEELSMPKLDKDQKNIPILKNLPDDAAGHPIRRWETFASTLPIEAWDEVLKNNTAYTSAAQVSNTLKKQEIIDNLKDDYGYIASLSNTKKALLDLLYGIQNNGALPTAAKTYTNAKELADARQELETYWKVGLRSKDWAGQKVFKDYNYDKKHAICTLIHKPDLILEVAYFCTDTGLFKKKVIFCEVDGDDKTSRPPIKSKEKEDADDDTEEEHESKKTQKMDPFKLAYKLMSSTNSQLSLHSDTYHIRSNWTVYQDHAIARSLMETTGIELPEFADLISTYQKNTQDYEVLHRAIHLVHHMFIAHVKIAFLIYMQVVHDIDMRRLDAQDKLMQNHCFFVNFDSSHVPDTLVFEEKMPKMTHTWMEERLMLHTRIGINTYNPSLKDNKWKVAPVLRADSSRSAMQDWNARVSSAPLPLFPYEKRTVVSVTCATIQRVNITRLIELVKTASLKALNADYEAARFKPRPNTRITMEGHKRDVKYIQRRQFPDRCFLTRKDQYNRTSMWNTYPASLRHRRISKDDDRLEFSWGYEDPNITRNFAGLKDPEDADETIWRQWDQVDVRMYYFDIAMNEQKDWKDIMNGMWYLQDYIDFFDALRKLAIHKAPASTDSFTCLEELPDVTALTVQEAKEIFAEYDCKMLALSRYAFLYSKKVSGTLVEVAEPRDLHLFYQTKPNESHFDSTPQRMPQQSASENRAYHIFSILSWFFDCRDGGACRWRWEDFLLDYFGANSAGDSPFDQFHFSQKQSQESAVSYRSRRRESLHDTGTRRPWFQQTHVKGRLQVSKEPYYGSKRDLLQQTHVKGRLQKEMETLVSKYQCS